ADQTGNQWFRFLKFVSKTKTICRLSSRVIVGNDELAEYARRFNPNVTVVPITIDMEEYAPRQSRAPGPPVIGWTGSYSTVPHLESIRLVLEKLGRIRRYEMSVMGTERFSVTGVPTRRE